MSRRIKNSPATIAERQARWRGLREGVEQRIEVWLPSETIALLKSAAQDRGQATKVLAARFIHRGLVGLTVTKRNKKAS